mgnify:CR=1 FL=1
MSGRFTNRPPCFLTRLPLCGTQPLPPGEARHARAHANLSFWLDVYRQTLYPRRVIKRFRAKDEERLHAGERVRRFLAFEQVARRKLRMLEAATELRDLSAAPGNRLEMLRGNRQGQYSIQINEQWRICFVWRGGDAYDVEIVDYHR